MNAKATKSTDAQIDGADAEISAASYWLLKDGKCPKLSKYSEGGIKY